MASFKEVQPVCILIGLLGTDVFLVLILKHRFLEFFFVFPRVNVVCKVLIIEEVVGASVDLSCNGLLHKEICQDFHLFVDDGPLWDIRDQV